MWVSGLEPGLRVITLGQNYVSRGVSVEPVTKEQMKALEKANKKAAASAEAEIKS